MEMKKERKGGFGRKKILIEKITDKSRRQKARELFVLCGAQFALITFSPVGKPYVCGNPDLILNRFHNSNDEIQKDIDELSVCHEQQRYLEVEEDLDVEKKRGLVLEMMINSNLMKSDMEKLKICVEKRYDELMSNIASSSYYSSSSSSRFIDDETNSKIGYGVDGQNGYLINDLGYDYENGEVMNELLFVFDYQKYEL
ncbi:hypothetical protein MKX01_026531 [Papaver californicum]|nr:hypothetical protein MKX01_026531 [Papaver californicum]